MGDLDSRQLYYAPLPATKPAPAPASPALANARPTPACPCFSLTPAEFDGRWRLWRASGCLGGRRALARAVGVSRPVEVGESGRLGRRLHPGELAVLELHEGVALPDHGQQVRAQDQRGGAGEVQQELRGTRRLH